MLNKKVTILSLLVVALMPSPRAVGAIGPTINTGGIVSAGLSQPAVSRVAPLSIVSVFGQNFAPPGTAVEVAASDVVNGFLPTNLGGVCITFEGVPGALFNVSPDQLNVQVPLITGTSAQVQVTSGCGTSSAAVSNSITVNLAPTSPEFFYFSLDGSNAIASVDATTGALVGPPGLLSSVTLTALNTGDIALLYATGLGAFQAPISAGQIPTAADAVSAPVSLFIGGAAVQPADVMYVGAAPGNAGLYQINVRIGSYVPPGNDSVILYAGGVTAPTAYLPIAPASPPNCDLPAINLFTAVPNQLAAPGTVTLNYTTENADTVWVGSSGSTQPGGTGSFNVNVTASTTFTLNAQNSCGTTQRSVVAAVGPPGVGGLANVAQPSLGAAAQPGQLIALQPVNLAQASAITQIFFTTPAGVIIESDSLGVDASGRILVEVPYIADNSAPQGYDTGSMQVTYMFNNQQSTAGSVNMLPLTYAGDPVADFSALIGEYFGAATQALTGFANDPNFGTSVSGMTNVLSGLYAELDQIATGLQSAASVQAPLDLITGPSAGTLTISRGDLAAWMAFNANLAASQSALNTVPQLAADGRSPRPRASQIHERDIPLGCHSTPLWLQVPAVPFCILVQNATNALAPAALVNQFVQLLPLDSLQEIASGATVDQFVAAAAKVGVYFLALEAASQAFCDLSPVYLNTTSLGSNIPFQLITTPTPLRLQQEQTVAIEAILTPKYGGVSEAFDDLLADQFAQLATNRVIGNIPAGVPPTVSVVKGQFKALFAAWLSNVLGSLQTKYPVASGSPVQIGDCDIGYFQPWSPYTNYSRLRMSAVSPQGNPDYYVDGLRPGTELMWLSLRPGNFLFLTPYEGDYFPELTVGYPKAVYFEDTGITGALLCYGDWTDCDGGPLPASIVPVTAASPLLSSVFGGGASAQASATQIDDSTWQVSVSANSVCIACDDIGGTVNFGNVGLYLILNNPPNSDNTQAIVVTASASGGCDTNEYGQGADNYEAEVGIGSSGDGGAVLALSPGGGPVTQTFSGATVGGLYLSVNWDDNSPEPWCQVTATVQMTGAEAGTVAASPVQSQIKAIRKVPGH